MFISLFHIAGLVLISTAVCFGVGRAIKGSNDVFFMNQFWIGWGVLLVVSQIFNLFIAVNWVISYSFIFLAIWGLSRIQYKCLCRDFFIKNWIYFVLCSLFLIWLSNRALSPNLNEDSGLYHLGVVNWIREFAVVPGVGNLHARLAFNNSSLFFPAVIDSLGFNIPSLRFSNSVLIFALFCDYLFLVKKYKNDTSPRAGFIVSYSLITFSLIFYLSFAAIGLDTDVPVMILGLVLIRKFVIYLTYPEKDFRLLSFIFLCSIGFTLKLSFGVFCFLMALIVLITSIMRGELEFCSKKLIWVLLIPIVVIGPFIARGYIMSGYPFFPSTFGSISVDWKIPEEEAELHTYAIRSFARDSSYEYIKNAEDMEKWEWFIPWLTNHFKEVKEIWIITMPLNFSFFAIVFGWACNRKSLFNLRRLLLYIPFVAVFIFWLIAPSPRFAGSLFWYFCIISSIPMIEVVTDRYSNLLRRAFIYIVLVVTVCLVGGYFIKPESVWTKSSEYMKHFPLPKTPYNIHFLSNSIGLYTPKSSDCLSWDLPLPSGPALPVYLELRDVTNLGYGFRDRRTMADEPSLRE